VGNFPQILVTNFSLYSGAILHKTVCNVVRIYCIQNCVQDLLPVLTNDTVGDSIKTNFQLWIFLLTNEFRQLRFKILRQWTLKRWFLQSPSFLRLFVLTQPPNFIFFAHFVQIALHIRVLPLKGYTLCRSDSLIPELPNTDYSCSQHSLVTVCFRLAQPSNVIPVPKTSTLLGVGVHCLSQWSCFC